MDKKYLRLNSDNPYILKIDEERNIYIVSFKDYQGIIQNVEITKEIYLVFKEYQSQKKREENEFDRHIEHSDLCENTLNKRILDKPITVEESVIRNSIFEDVRRAIEELPEIQKRRIKKYYFDNKTFEQIASEEKCTKRAVKFSVDIAIKEIYKKLIN